MSHRHEGPKHAQFDRNVVQFLVKVFRDLVIFALGGVGFVHELLRSGDERAQILIMSAAMMGLPLIIRGDEKRQEAKSHDNRTESG